MRGSESLKRNSSGLSIAALYAAERRAASSLLGPALLPGDVLPEQRHRGHRHLGRTVLHLARMRQIDQRVVFLVVNAVHHLLLPDKADALLEDFLATFAK